MDSFNVKVTVNNQTYDLVYNHATRQYEKIATAPLVSSYGINNYYPVTVQATDEAGNITIKNDKDSVIGSSLRLRINEATPADALATTVIYILDKDTLEIKDIVQTDTYNTSLDVRLTGKSSFTIVTPLQMVTGDYIIKKRKAIEYQGVITTVETVKKNNIYKIYTMELASIFNRQIILSGIDQIETVGIETFVESTIKTYFTNSSDTFLNIKCIDTIVKTNTPMDIEVDNTDGIYNFFEFLGFINETYGVGLEFKMENKKWIISIVKNEPTTMDVDATISDIVTYNESYQVDTISKVVVLSKKTQLISEYFLLIDGTITTDSTDVNRAKGTIETVTCARDKEARQKAEDTFRKNSYQHNIVITLTKDSKLYSIDDFKVGQLLRIKTESSGIYNTFVAKIDTASASKIYTITCGNMKVTLLEKLKGVTQ